MQRTTYYYVLVQKRQDAIRLLQKARDASVPCCIAPAPRSSGKICGVSVRVAQEHLDAIQELIRSHQLPVERIMKPPEKQMIGRF
ncbi:MAG: DUF3343 domain-containing protein [Solirubrobacterales bacterium]